MPGENQIPTNLEYLKHLHFGLRGAKYSEGGRVRQLIPREIYDAGLALIDDERIGFEPRARKIITSTTTNLLEAIEEYKNRTRIGKTVRI